MFAILCFLCYSERKENDWWVIMIKESEKMYKTKTGYAKKIMKYEKIEGHDEPVLAVCGYIEYDEDKNKVYENITKIKYLPDGTKTSILKIIQYSHGKIISYHKGTQDGSYIAKEENGTVEKMDILENNLRRRKRISEFATEITIYKYLENTMCHTIARQVIDKRTGAEFRIYFDEKGKAIIEKIKSGEINNKQLLSTKPNIKAVDNAKLTSTFEENECIIEIWRKDDGEVEKVITRIYKDEIVLEEHYVKHSSDVLRKEMHYVWTLNENGNYDIVIDGRDKELFWYSNIVQKDKNEGQ